MSSRKAFGVIETMGFIAAVEAADAAAKSANVTLLGYEFARGGLVAVGFTGDVGAVKAAVDSGTAAAGRIGTVRSQLVIPRPHTDTESLIARFGPHESQRSGSGSGTAGGPSSSSGGAKKTAAKSAPAPKKEAEPTPEAEAKAEPPLSAEPEPAKPEATERGSEPNSDSDKEA